MKGRRWIRRAVITFVLLMIGGAVTFGVYRLRAVEASANLPTAPVRKGEFTVIVRCRGDLKAQRSAQVTAPVNVPELRIIWIAAQGSRIQVNEPIVRFDRHMR